MPYHRLALLGIDASTELHRMEFSFHHHLLRDLQIQRFGHRLTFVMELSHDR